MNIADAALQTLVQRYNRPGPRYTSYPTAPVWQESIQAQALRQKLAQKESPAALISLYLHIPFCREICHFCGCNTFQQNDANFAKRYVDYMIREIELLASQLPAPRQTVQMHWGGGTPTFLNESEISRLYHAVTKYFTFMEGAEIAIELDPRVTSHQQAVVLRQLGFNRVSFGVQDNDLKVQQASNRVQPPAVTAALYQSCRDLKFESINFDLIYGLPLQTPESFARTVADVIAWQPDRIALFSYAHVPWLKPFQRKINSAELPPAESKFTTFLQTRERFTQAGYVTIGMDHFARPQDELAKARQQQRLRRNFQGYTVKPPSHVHAIGISGISDLGDLYVQNTKKFNQYYQAIDQGEFAIERGYQLSRNDRIRRQVIMQLMCNFVVDFTAIEKAYELNFKHYFEDELQALQPFIDDQLVELVAHGLQVTELGQLFVRNVAMVFDDHLAKSSGSNTFSKTV